MTVPNPTPDADDVMSEAVTPKEFRATTPIDLMHKVFKHHGWPIALGRMAARFNTLYEMSADARNNRYVATPRAATERDAAREAVSADMLAEVMQDAWSEICDDAGAHPSDIRREGRKLFYVRHHWTDLIALRLNERLDRPSPEAPATKPDQSAGERVERMREALIMARDLIAVIGQSRGNVWAVRADDPETAVCDTSDAIDAALTDPMGSVTETGEGSLIGKLLAMVPWDSREDEWYDARDAWRATRGDAGMDDWSWWFGHPDNESYDDQRPTREQALEAARIEYADQAIRLVEARLWSDDLDDGEDIMPFAETRNYEIIAASPSSPVSRMEEGS